MTGLLGFTLSRENYLATQLGPLVAEPAVHWYFGPPTQVRRQARLWRYDNRQRR
jgi:hypothetical protein